MSNPSKKFHETLDEPTLRDSKILLKIDDLIALTFGTSDVSIPEIKLTVT